MLRTSRHMSPLGEMSTRRPTSALPTCDYRESKQRDQQDPPIRLGHVLFVFWVAGSVAWDFIGVKLADDRGWWVQHPELAAALVLAPPLLGHLLANFLVKLAGNPKFRS